MLRVSLKGILARKLRLLLTSVAIVLGVGFVSGAYFLTDTMRGSFDSIFTQAYAGIDAEVKTKPYADLAKAAGEGQLVPIDLARVGVSPKDVEKVAAVDGVKQANGAIFEVGAQPLGKDGKPIAAFGPPSFAANFDPETHDRSVIEVVKGAPPKRGEMMLDAMTFDKAGYKVGDKAEVLIQGGRAKETLTISGVVKFGDSGNLNGAGITVFDTKQLQELLQMGDRFSVVEVVAEDGITQNEIRDRVADALSPKYVVTTGTALAAEQTQAIDEGFLKYLEYVILAFAFVAVFVGAFTIFNTFTILVSQRTREFGLLRMLGARRGQVLGIVALEALVTGIVASTIGIIVGYGIATLLRLMLGFIGFDLPSDPFPIKQRTIIISYVVGVFVTLIASVVPAWRASRLSPLETIRMSTTSHDSGVRVPAIGGLLFLLGAGFIGWGLFTAGDGKTSTVLISIAVGFLVLIIGLSMLSRLLIAPVTHALAPLFARGRTGRIAVGNVLRNRSRAATTSSALMIGLALAALTLVFYASIQQTVDDQIELSVGADITVVNTSFGGSLPTISDAQVEKIRSVDGIDVFATQYLGTMIFGDTFDIASKKPYVVGAFTEGGIGTDDELVRTKMVDGTMEPGNGIVVDEDLATKLDLQVGSDAAFAFPTGTSERLKIVGIFEKTQAVGSQAIISLEQFRTLQPAIAQSAATVNINIDKGAKSKRVVKDINKVLGDDSSYISVLDSDGIKDLFRTQLQPIVGMVFAMLSMSLVIGLFGIGNTLALNVFERTREIGLLRAVGGTRRQLRRIIRAESVLVALFGAIVGILVGIGAGAALIFALRDEGFSFAISPVAMLVVLLGGFIAGIFASVMPARRAARIDVLAAIATD
ncbi:MAG: FtsX-like permease family protein [Gaiellales bacterium]